MPPLFIIRPQGMESQIKQNQADVASTARQQLALS